MAGFDPLWTLGAAGTNVAAGGQMSYPSNQNFMAALTSLLDQWCEHRRYRHLAAVLPSFVSFNGLTDGSAELSAGLKSAVGLGGEGLSDDEWNILQSLSRDADTALSSR